MQKEYMLLGLRKINRIRVQKFIDLKNEFPNIQGFSVRNMRKIYEKYPSFEILQTLSAKLIVANEIKYSKNLYKLFDK